MNLDMARFNMVEQQIRTWEVFDPAILQLMNELKRENFVAEELKELAYADSSLPIGCGQVMLPPREHARILQALQVRPHEKILEIGTGTGYLTALLAQLGSAVLSIEIYSELLKKAAIALKPFKFSNLVLEEGDGAQAWSEQQPYDVIVLTGSLPYLPEAFKQQLAINGRLFAFLGKAPVMTATLLTRLGEQEWRQIKLYETVVPRLLHAATQPRFQL